ncbi:hypothetical protein [Anatilimnocola floriformis]|uniref:hypothetical protein n=1 Tax=Anatilimnocola floriformis TaxID=2948575 RepID=UPI0020C2AA7D|nr:hypothetical protein [Anatilimnocola floriformis]
MKLRDEASDPIEEILSRIEPFGGQIEESYHSHWRHVIDEREDSDLAILLGKIARLRPAIDLRWVESWAGAAVVDRLRRSLFHLFRRESRDRWYVFHNSFRQFLLRRTAESPPDGFDESRDNRIHSEIADLCAAELPSSHWSWEEAYHRHRAGEHAKSVAAVNVDRLRGQLLAFRDIDAIQGDIRLAIASAGALRDFVALTRLLFVGAEFSSRGQSLSTVSLHELLLGNGDVEKACARIRHGRLLRISDSSALEFSCELLAIGLNQEARIIFELAEPIGLLKGAQTDRELVSNQIEVLKAWANVAVSFRSIVDIVKLIRGARQHGNTWDRNADPSEKILRFQDNMLTQAGYGLIASHKWDDLDLLIEELKETSLKGHKQFSLYVRAWKECREIGETSRARRYVERALTSVDSSDLGDDERTHLSEGLFRIIGDKVRAKEVFSKIAPPTLTSDPGMGDRIGPYLQRIRYSRLLYTFGDKRTATDLIPDGVEGHQRGAVYFERGLSEIGRLWAMAWRGIELDGTTFTMEAKPLLLLFCRDWNTEEGRSHWRLLTHLRSDFYELLVRAAQDHGVAAVRELGVTLEREWFEGERSNFWPASDIREITKQLFRSGADKTWCNNVFARTESLSSDDTDVSGRVSWRAGQAECWILIGESARAQKLLTQILEGSAGVEYRKDYQLDSWIEWMREVNSSQPEGAEDRTNLLASAVISLVESTEGRAAKTAAAALLNATFDWSPRRAVELCRILSESGAIDYESGAAIIAERALHSENPPCELCLNYSASVLIPISTDSEDSLATAIVGRCGKNGGNESAQRAADILARSVKIYGFPESRSGWLRGIAMGLQGLGLPIDHLDAITESAEEPRSILNLKDGSQLSRYEISERIRSTDDFFSLIDAEAGDSYFDWTPQIRELAKSLNADDVYSLADQLQLRRGEAMGLGALAERICELGDKERAWELGIRAVESSHKKGWIRFYDGGTTQAAFRSLVSVDAEKAREMAFKSLVDFLTSDGWYPLHVAMSLDEIAPIVCDSVPTLEIWIIIESYLHAIFFHSPELRRTYVGIYEPGNDTVHRAITDLICEFLGHPAQLLAEGAIRACADLLISDNIEIRGPLQQILTSGSIQVADTLIALDAVSAIDVSRVQAFTSQIGILRNSADQSIRWTAIRISRRLGLAPIESHQAVSLHSGYQGRAIVPGTVELDGGTKPSSFGIFPDSLDPYDLVSPWRLEVETIAKAAGLQFEGVLMRIIEFMRKISAESTWNSEAEKILRRQMDNAKLAFPYRRPRWTQGRRAIFHVLAELSDGGRLPAEGLNVFEEILRRYDADLVFRRPLTRPSVIRSTICPKYNEFNTTWVSEGQSLGIGELCTTIGGRTVVAELTSLKPAGNAMPSEKRASSLFPKSVKTPRPSADKSRFFPCLVRQLVKTYHDSSSETDGFPAVVHLGYGYDTPGEGWVAFDPGLARSLGWQPSDKGYLAWERDGELMVETMWWNDGCLDHAMPFYRKLEVGEGWLVVASEDALHQIEARIGPLKRVCAITREVFENRDPVNRTKYFESD